MALSLLAFLVLVQSAVYCSVVNKNIFVDIDRPPWQNIPEVSTVDEVTVSEMHSVTLLLRYPADPTPTGSTKEALQVSSRKISEAHARWVYKSLWIVFI